MGLGATELVREKGAAMRGWRVNSEDAIKAYKAIVR